MKTPEGPQFETPETTSSKEELRLKPTPERLENKPGDSLAAFINGLSVYKANHPDKYGFGLLKRGEGLPLTEKGEEFASMITGYWIKESESYDELCETLFAIRKEGRAYFRSRGEKKEETVLLAILKSAEDRRANIEKGLTKYNLESKFPGIEAQVLPWQIARIQQKGREMLAAGPPEVVDAITRTLAIEELAEPIAEAKTNLLKETWQRFGGHISELKIALNITLTKVLPERKISETSKTPEEAVESLVGTPDSEAYEKIVQATNITIEKLTSLEANPEKINAGTVEEVLKEVQNEESTGQRLWSKISSRLPTLTPRTKAKVAVAIVAAGFLVTTVGSLQAEQVYAQTPGRGEAAIILFEPTSMSDPRIEFAKTAAQSEFDLTPIEKGQIKEFRVSPRTTKDPKTGDVSDPFFHLDAGYTMEQLEGLPGMYQKESTCRLTVFSEAANLVSDRDLNPVEFSSLMRDGAGEIETFTDLNKFTLYAEKLKPYGVEVKTVPLREVLLQSSESAEVALSHYFENELKQGHIPVIFHSVRPGVAHTLPILAIGHEKDGTPFAILGETHRGKHVAKWPHFQKSGIEQIGDYVKITFNHENWEDGLSKYLGVNTVVFSKAEG